MDKIHALLLLFGERYIFTDNAQAKLDLEQNRDNMIDAFQAILEISKEEASHERSKNRPRPLPWA